MFALGNLGLGTEAPAAWKWNWAKNVAIPLNHNANGQAKTVQEHLRRLAVLYKLPSPGKVDGELGPSAFATYNKLRTMPLAVSGLQLYSDVKALAEDSMAVGYTLAQISGGTSLPLPASPPKATSVQVASGPALPGAQAAGFALPAGGGSKLADTTVYALGIAAVIAGVMYVRSQAAKRGA